MKATGIILAILGAAAGAAAWYSQTASACARNAWGAEVDATRIEVWAALACFVLLGTGLSMVAVAHSRYPYKTSRAEKAVDVGNVFILAFIALLALYPFIYTLSISLSTATEASRRGWHLFPRELSLAAYRMVLSNPEILTGYVNTTLRTVLGTAITLFMTCLCAYPLSRKNMPHRRLVIFLILFTMIFNGGIVPTYLLIRNLGLMDSLWALILPSMLTAFNIIIVKNFFQSIPESFGEAARVEGAGEWSILFRIYIPLSKPVLATIALWTAVMHWNQWFDAMLYITSDRNQVLQTFLQRIVIQNSTAMLDIGLTKITEYSQQTIKAATVIITILPIVMVYPFVQRYFVKGILLGGIKE
jgi:putative aldouronate transport system permease protein